MSIAKYLEAAGIRHAPFGAVSLGHPDGTYFNESTVDRSVQIVVVGRMTRTPAEVADLVNEAIPSHDHGSGYWVKSVSVIPGEPGSYTAQLAIERGFVSIILANYADEKRPCEPEAANGAPDQAT